MAKALKKLKLRRNEKSKFEKILRSRKEPSFRVFRSQIILMASEGISNYKISKRLECTAHTVGKWRQRYEEHGIAGIEDLGRSGRPRLITEEQRKEVVSCVCQKPPHGYSRWSVRTLAKHVNLPKTLVHGILKEHDLHPHRVRTFTFSPDPNFEDKLLEVVGLYMKPPQNAVVLCVDEKTGIQALDRTQPMLPLRSKKPTSWTNEYVRHGTRTLIASLDISTGKVLSHVRDNRRSETFLKFLDHVVKRNKSKRLCIVMDNLNTHNNKAAQEWLEDNPNVTFHFTPTHASWVNLIECFFSVLTKQGLQQAVHKSGKELEVFLKQYIKQYNKGCGPFTWTKGPRKLKQIIKLTKEYQSS